MRSENGFCHGTGLEQAETEQNSVAHNAPNGVDGVPGNCHALDQHGINCHADEDEKALKAQCEQAFQVVLPHVRLLVVAPCCHGDGRKAHHAVNFNHTSVDDDEDHDAQYPHSDADEETLQEKPEQGADVHLHQAGLQHRQTNVVDMGISGNDAAGPRELGKQNHRRIHRTKYTGNLLSALHITGGIFMDNLFFMVAIPLFYRDEFDKNVRSSVCMLRCGWSGEQGTADSENGFINVANMDER